MVELIIAGTADPELIIHADGWSMDSVEDLPKLKHEKVGRLTVTAPGKVELSIGRGGSWIAVVDPDLQARGMMHGVLQIAQRCRRVGGRQLIVRIASGVVVVAAAAAWVATRDIIGGLCVAAFIAIAVGGFVAEFNDSLDRTTISSRPRAEAPTFWRRKRDDLWIEVVVSLVSLLLGGVVGFWINTITSNQ